MKVTALLDSRPWVRLLQVLAGVLAAMMATLILLALVSERMMMRRLVAHQGALVSTTVQGAMSESLAIGDSDAVREQFAALRQASAGIEVFVFDERGIISFATDPDKVGGDLRQVTAGRLPWSDPAGSSTGSWSEVVYEEDVGGVPALSVVRPIGNAVRCHHCHGSSRRLLGGIMVRSSTEGATSAIRLARNFNIVIGLVGLGGALLLMRRLLVRVVRDLLRDVLSGGETMAASSADLRGVSARLSGDSMTAASRAASVTGSVSAVNGGLVSIAAAMEESSTAADSISVATEQMTASAAEIAREAANAARVTSDATERAARAMAMIDGLSREADAIGSVTQVINRISDQIDLLALNATIESARAGDAGRGFAVVAEEIKKLARETSESIEVIRGRIDGVRASTDAMVQQVSGFADLMRSVDATVTTIAAAVEEQAAVTDEIASSVAHTNSGIRQATADVSRIAAGLGDISADMAEVNAVTETVSAGAAAIDERSAELAELAARMNALIARFRI